DQQTGEPLMGATITWAEGKGTSTNLDGLFQLELPNGTYELTVRYVGYNTVINTFSVKSETQTKDFELTADNTMLGDVTVVGQTRLNTEVATLKEQQRANVAMVTVSDQQIKRTQDKDASEVIRRIPGVSIIDEKFVMVRGLAQRYNNVWMNEAAVASSEADQRAFSFDIIPSSQIENMKVVKTAAPEFPADFTGGFILINTKDVPLTDSWSVSLGGSNNSETHFKDFLYYKNNRHSLMHNGIDVDWKKHCRKPVADWTASATIAKRWLLEGGQTIGLTGSFNGSNNLRTMLNSENNLFGAYDVTHDRSNYLRKAIDDQYSNNNRLGGMLGLVWLSPTGRHCLRAKQVINHLTKDRYTYRKGFDAQSDYMEQAEYYYQSRLTYNLGLSGKHTLTDNDQVDWNLGYVFANRSLPDRRRYAVFGQEDGTLEVENLNDINREYSLLKEHIYSGGVNWKHDFSFNDWKPSLKMGAYGEYRTRKYDTRFFTYAWPSGQLPQELRKLDVPTQLLTREHYGDNGLYMHEQVDWSNNYAANGTLGSGFAALLLPFFDNRLEAYGGLRFESYHTELISHTRRQEYSPLSTFYDYNDLFPSLNLTYHLNDTQQLRAAYGRTTNRPEFRELSTSVYYDFDLASNVQGNHNLKPAYIDNLDLGWEWYPNAGEVVSISLFYKRFKDPIEWTYTVAGGTDLVYSYMNAKGANNYGIELEARKQLDFCHLPQFSLSVNAAWIKSEVTFAEGSREKDRPMQGQSPYLVNVGLFYNSDQGKPSANWQKGWSASLLYNTIGKRIIGVGRSVGSGETDVRVPDSYEMPRHQLDMNIGKSFGKLDLRLSLRDVLAQKVLFKQFEQTPHGEVEQITRSYKPGRNIGLTLTYKM
ncbi:MAG: TonB-dependent receptor, partial [Bacteroidales bacterium]|nr:TonB-dependent receptor [Bacteroidales bacterium]